MYGVLGKGGAIAMNWSNLGKSRFTAICPRFLVIFAACILSLVGKGIALASPTAIVSGLEPPWFENKEPNEPVFLLLLNLAVMLLPGFLLGLASTWHRGIFKSILAHPSIVLMPTFTHFTFSASTKCCGARIMEESNENGMEERSGVVEEERR